MYIYTHTHAHYIFNYLFPTACVYNHYNTDKFTLQLMDHQKSQVIISSQMTQVLRPR